MMNIEEPIQTQRIRSLHYELEKSGVIEEPVEDTEIQHKNLHVAINEFENLSREQYENTNKAKLTYNLSKAAYVGIYIDGSDEVELHDYIKERRWTSRDTEALAVRTLRDYIALRKKAEKRGAKAPEYEWDEKDQLDLDETIFELMDEGRIDDRYGGQLRLLMGKVKAKPGTPLRVIETVLQQGSYRLRSDAAKFKTTDKTEIIVTKGLETIKRMLGHSVKDVKTLRQLAALTAFESGSDKDNLAELTTRLEGIIAHTLEALYGE